MNRKYLVSTISALAVLSTPLWASGCLVANAAPTSTMIYVSPTGNDTTGTGTVANPYQTISHAVLVAPANGTVIVEPGTYKEMVTIAKPLTLESDAMQPQAATTTIIDASGLDNGIFVHGTAAAGTVIKGLTVENANNHGIWVRNTSHVMVENNIVINNGLAPTKTSTTAIAENKPILLDGTASSVVAHNVVKNNKADGGISVTDYGMFDPGAPEPTTPPKTPISGAPTIKAVPGVGNLIMDNDIENDAGGCGVVVAAYNPGGGVIDNEVLGNTVNKIVAGVVVAADSPNTVAKNNIVLNNTITNNFIPGVIIHSNTPGDSVDGNVVIGNTISQNGPDKEVGDNSSTGIVLAGDVMPVTNTIISNNSIANETYGIFGKNAPGTQLSNQQFASSVSIHEVGLTPSIVVYLNHKNVATIPVISDNNMTYVPVWNVMQFMKQMKITSHWNGKDLTFQTPSMNIPHSSENIRKGTMSIDINGVKIASTEGFAAPTSYGYTTFMPLSSMIQALNVLGYTSTWNDSVWSILK